MPGFIVNTLPKLCYGATIAGAVFLALPTTASPTLNMLITLAQKHTLPFTFVATGLTRLVLSLLRDELYMPNVAKPREEVLEETLKNGTSRPIVSNRSLIISSLITLLSHFVDPHLCLPVASATLGWETSGLVYNVIGRVYSS